MILFALFFIAGFFVPALPWAAVVTVLMHVYGVIYRRDKWQYHFQNSPIVAARSIATGVVLFALVNTALMALGNMIRHAM